MTQSSHMLVRSYLTDERKTAKKGAPGEKECKEKGEERTEGKQEGGRGGQEQT